MNPSTRERSRTERRIRAEAAAWIARLHGPDRAPELETGFRQWLAEHPTHAAEFELATDAWNETAGLSAHAPLRLWSDRRAIRRNLFAWQTAAGLAVCLLATAWILHMLGRSAVTTGVGEQKTISLADGTRVTLNTNSRIVVSYGNRTRTVILRYGEAYFQVVHDQARPFIVEAGDQNVIDVGTSFMVRRNGTGKGSLSVTVIEGRVAVAPLDVANIVANVHPLKVLFVSAGNRLLLRPHARPLLQPEPMEQATAWLRGQLIFNGTALGDAAAQFNRYNLVQIRVEPSGLKKIRVSGLFRIGASRSFARTVAQAYHLRLIVRHEELVLSPKHAVASDRLTNHR